MRAGRARRWRVGVVLCAALAAGCARKTLLLPVALEPPAPTRPVPTGPPRNYESAVNVIAAILVSELGLPLPSRFTVVVFPSRAAYAAGLANSGQVGAPHAEGIAADSVGLARHRELFLNDGALRGACGYAWLAVLAHELTHVAQYELSAGRRGRSEQWIREGMAEWVAYRVLDRLGAAAFADQRERAMREVAAASYPLLGRGLGLVDLGRPRGWAARQLRPGGQAQYRLAFLLTDELVRRGGWDRLLEYFRAFADSDERFGTFHRAFGLSLEEFERRALDGLGRRHVGRDPTGITASRTRDASGELPLIEDADRCQE